MTALAVASTALVLVILALLAFGPELLALLRRRRRLPAPRPAASRDWDPGQEMRAERKARQLLAEVVSREELEMYEELGFINVDGGGGEESAYAYLVYPHRPIVAYETATESLLNEYCVTFPDRSESQNGHRLPDADDVLAKWMTLHGGERALIEIANMHVPGRQLDPVQVRRDLIRLREWRAARARRPEASSTPQAS